MTALHTLNNIITKGVQPNGSPCANNHCSTRYEQCFRYNKHTHTYQKADTDQHSRAPNDTAYKRWGCHSGLKRLFKLCRTSPPPAMGPRFTVFCACRPCGPAGWLALLLTNAGDVETNPGPRTLNKKVWICDICHKQIHVRKQISIRCNRIEHWCTSDVQVSAKHNTQIPGPAIYTENPDSHLTQT